MNLKFLEKFSKNLSKTGKIAEVFFLRLRFHHFHNSRITQNFNFEVSSNSKYQRLNQGFTATGRIENASFLDQTHGLMKQCRVQLYHHHQNEQFVQK